MSKQYNQLTLKERKQIEEGLDRGDSFRQIASLIGRKPSTVSREVKENRHAKSPKAKATACRDRDWCKRVCVCQECVRPGSYCSQCDARDCREECAAYSSHVSCGRMGRAPWVCNGCCKRHYCGRRNRYAYDAQIAQSISDGRRSDSRKGIDMEPERAEIALAQIKDAVSRGLSPYEISVLYADSVGVHQSTIYRWVEAGYGGLSNIELERKVGFRPRKKRAPRKSTSHSKKRRHDEFEKLADEARAARTEIDCVCGRSVDAQAVLTLYNLPCHVQLGLLLEAHDCASVKKELESLKSVMPQRMFAAWMRTALTDNGEEFSDEDGIGAILGERVVDGGLAVQLYYCDPRQSQQKGGCEKNHTEIRQILEKGMFAFDELTRADLSVLMSHANSNPRRSLGGKSPIQMLRFVYGDDDARALMDALGIVEVGRDELMLKPEILDIERGKRGEARLTRLK